MNTTPFSVDKCGFHFVVIAVMLLSIGLTGCGTITTKPADYMSPVFDNALMDRIVVLPVLDHRIDQSKALKLDDWVMPITERSLKARGYVYTIQRDRVLISNISRDVLESPSKEFIASLKPEEANWILLLCLEDSSSKLTFGSTGNAEMCGYLFDKSKAEMVWRDKALGRMGQGGLVGMFMKGMMERGAVESAAGQIFQTLPPREKE